MTAPPAGIRRAAVDDAPRLVDVLVHAFDADPFFRWMFGPDEAAFRAGPRRWIELVVGLALPRGEGWLAGEDGAAIWLPPGAEVADAEGLALAGRLLEELVGERTGEVLAAIGSGATSVPDEPHWLCLYIGVRPRAQGGGIGRALMAPGIGASDASGAPSHLMSTNPATTPFYERLGYRTLAVTSAEPGVPPLRPMWRDARPD